MCLLVIAWKSHPEFDLILAANRDEFLQRPARAAEFWDEHPKLLAGKDLEAGGTWLGVTVKGKFCAITNYRDMRNHKKSAPTRGNLPLNYLAGDLEPQPYIESIRPDAHRFNGFNLLLGNKNSLWYYSNIVDRPEELNPGIYGLSNHLLDTPWPKVERAKRSFSAIISDIKPDHERLFALLQDRTTAPDHLLPDTGLDRMTEKKLSSAFIEMEGYGTRSSTILLLKKSGQIEFRERINQKGNTIPARDINFTFTVDK
ncbi:MAG: NRDE family protein [Cyclonatronaceae bacterium]